jgi:hypothetical protein
MHLQWTQRASCFMQEASNAACALNKLQFY